MLILSNEKEERKENIKAVRTFCTLRASTQTAKEVNQVQNDKINYTSWIIRRSEKRGFPHLDGLGLPMLSGALHCIRLSISELKRVYKFVCLKCLHVRAVPVQPLNPLRFQSNASQSYDEKHAA